MHRSRWDRLESRMDVQVAACFELTLCCQASKACKSSTEAFGPRHTTDLYSWPRGRQPIMVPLSFKIAAVGLIAAAFTTLMLKPHDTRDCFWSATTNSCTWVRP
jgi:hypothetical protein